MGEGGLEFGGWGWAKMSQNEAFENPRMECGGQDDKNGIGICNNTVARMNLLLNTSHTCVLINE